MRFVNRKSPEAANVIAKAKARAKKGGEEGRRNKSFFRTIYLAVRGPHRARPPDAEQIEAAIGFSAHTRPQKNGLEALNASM